ncbi:glycosyl transferase group 2 [Candidatus Termititenax persephonae]|uniref:Glycosyl transferase group 2 n=1 Tax=Candidatus Termititenax persephonae TaxID=2218525 RepID=A0A388TFI0_9BACT|nr:glycosyl transferase group 2 [Candidatus Termititenax persephonae]
MATIKNLPQVSVIIPVYGTEKYLPRCLDSILAQTFSDWECILVDDVSPDNCPRLCDEYAVKDKRFKVVHEQENLGAPLARKSGIVVASGDYLICIDSDDWIEPTMLAKMYAQAVTGDCGVVCCDFVKERHGQVEGYLKQGAFCVDKPVNIKNLLGNRTLHNAANKLVKREIYNQIIFPRYYASDDWVMAIQFAYYADNIGYVPEALYHYCFSAETDNNTWKRSADKISLDHYENFRIIVRFLEDKFGTNIEVLEPELSDAVNLVKYPFVENRKIRDLNKLVELYPRSNKFIFNRTLKISWAARIVFWLAARRIIVPWAFELRSLYEKIVSLVKK